jgi:hypothetical protein
MPKEPAEIAVERFWRAAGSLILALFGTVWIFLSVVALNVFWLWEVVVLLAAVLVVTPAAINFVRARRITAQSENSIASKHKGRLVLLINGIQWILILLAAWQLNRTGQTLWIVPVISVIVALHFIPLAWVLEFPPYYTLAAATLILVVVVYHFLGLNPYTADGIIALGTGFFLWLSSIGIFSRAR